MKNDDFGFYGKGTSGYVHYKQAFDESQKNQTDNSKRSQQQYSKRPFKAKDISGILIYYSPFLLGIVALVLFLHWLGG